MTTTNEFDSMLWRALLVGGIITAAIGAALAFWPDIAITLIGWLVAIQFVILGLVFMVGKTITGEGAGSVILGIILGAIGIWVGVIAFRNPTGVVAILTFIIGAGWFIGGVVEVFDAIANKDTPARGWVMLLGAISAAAGLLLLFYPVESAATLAVLTGIVMIIVGIARVIQAFQVKGQLGA